MFRVTIYFAVTDFVIVCLSGLLLLTRWEIRRLRHEPQHSFAVFGAVFVLLVSPWLPRLAVGLARDWLADAQAAFNASYFALAYSVIVMLLLAWSLGLRQDKHRRRAVPWLMGLVLLLSPWFPYGAVYAQTAVFGRDLLPSVHQAFRVCGGSCGEEEEPILTYQVLRITPSHAEVLVVQPCIGGMMGVDAQGKGYEGTTGQVLHFQKTAHGWKYQDRADVSWSGCGSADGNVFPPHPYGM